MTLYGIKKADGAIETDGGADPQGCPFGPFYDSRKWAKWKLDCGDVVGESVVPVQVIEALPPLREDYTFRVVRQNQRCPAFHSSPDRACVYGSFKGTNWCLGTYATPVAEAMVARLNLPGGDAR